MIFCNYMKYIIGTLVKTLFSLGLVPDHSFDWCIKPLENTTSLFFSKPLLKSANSSGPLF